MSTATAVESRVFGIEVARLSEAAVSDALAHYDIHPSKDVRFEGRVELLVEHFREHVSDADEAVCHTCGGTSDVNYPAGCPFCGENDEQPSTIEPELAEEDAGGGPEPEPEPPAEEDATDITPAALEAPKAPAEEPKQVRQTRRKPKAVTAEQVEIAKAKAAPETRAIEKKAPGGAMTVAVLDAQVKAIKQIDTRMRGATWEMACGLKEIAEQQSWKLRKDEAGKVAYSTFEEFANQELDITREYANLYMRVAARCTQAEVVAYGITKIREALNAPPRKQEEAFRMLQEGKTRREIARAMKPESRDEDIKKRRRPAGEKAPAKSSGMTVAVVEGAKTVKLYCKAAKKGEDRARAKRLADEPYGWLDLENDVRLWFTIGTNAAGELQLRVETKRQPPIK